MSSINEISINQDLDLDVDHYTSVNLQLEFLNNKFNVLEQIIQDNQRVNSHTEIQSKEHTNTSLTKIESRNLGETNSLNSINKTGKEAIILDYPNLLIDKYYKYYLT